MIAGRIAGPAAALMVLKKPRAEAPGNARQFGLRLHHEYFGRYMIFGFLALLQGTLVCLGDMFYLGVQCEHPIQFLMVGWLSALVFSNIVYTLTLSFGDIGKAIAVVLLVMQVAGSGGTFPIETLPTFFQVVSKWLLFPMRGCDAFGHGRLIRHGILGFHGQTGTVPCPLIAVGTYVAQAGNSLQRLGYPQP